MAGTGFTFPNDTCLSQPLLVQILHYLLHELLRTVQVHRMTSLQLHPIGFVGFLQFLSDLLSHGILIAVDGQYGNVRRFVLRQGGFGRAEDGSRGHGDPSLHYPAQFVAAARCHFAQADYRFAGRGGGHEGGGPSAEYLFRSEGVEGRRQLLPVGLHAEVERADGQVSLVLLVVDLAQHVQDPRGLPILFRKRRPVQQYQLGQFRIVGRRERPAVIVRERRLPASVGHGSLRDLHGVHVLLVQLFLVFGTTPETAAAASAAAAGAA
mmetsp:Transcript_43073/g.91610  ORF Transcript_43073/g.91610 Transcript_43073/m.91610 type:complete len:266 (+) Transcript_43073:273-1070(+)